MGTLIDLIQRMTGERPDLTNLNAAASALGETLGRRRVLLVIDDVWRAQDLRPFLQGGPRTTRLVTTRLDRVLPDDAFKLPVDAMTPLEAVELLQTGLPAEDIPAASAALRALAERLGEWAQLLKLVNGFLRNRTGRGEPLDKAIANVARRLDEKGLTAFDAGDEADRTKAVARTIEVSLELVDEAARARFAELAVFPEDVDVPVDVVAALWARTGGLGELDTEDRLEEFAGLSLVLALELDRRTFRFHDTTRAYLRTKAGDGLAALNAELIAALAQPTSPAAERYDLLHRPEHLDDAGDRDALDTLLTDPAWIDRKIGALGGATEIIADYDRFADGARDARQPLIGRTLRLSSRILARDPRQAMPQLHGRLISAGAPAALLGRLVDRMPAGALYETRPALTPATGAETARLEGHQDGVTALAVLPDGRLASGSDDHTIRLWDPDTGTETARLEGQKRGRLNHRALCLL